MKTFALVLLLITSAQAAHAGCFYFHADWCEPCKQIATPLIDRANNDQCDIEKVNVDKDSTYAKLWGYNGKGVPQFVVTDRNDKVLRRHVGATLDYKALKKFYRGTK